MVRMIKTNYSTIKQMMWKQGEGQSAATTVTNRQLVAPATTLAKTASLPVTE
jgi:hypothetical protein